jgi:hypothetical protein
MMKARRLALILVLAAAAVVSGCGSDNSSDSSDNSGTSAQQPVRKYNLADVFAANCEKHGGYAVYRSFKYERCVATSAETCDAIKIPAAAGGCLVDADLPKQKAAECKSRGELLVREGPGNYRCGLTEEALKQQTAPDQPVYVNGGCYSSKIGTPESCKAEGGNWQSSACFFDEGQCRQL